jgi:hypothetical protein
MDLEDIALSPLYEHVQFVAHPVNGLFEPLFSMFSWVWQSLGVFGCGETLQPSVYTVCSLSCNVVDHDS